MTDIAVGTTSAASPAPQGSTSSPLPAGSGEDFRAVLDEALNAGGKGVEPAEDSTDDGSARHKDGNSPGSAPSSARASLIRAELRALVASQSAPQGSAAAQEAAGSVPVVDTLGGPVTQKGNASPLGSVSGALLTPDVPAAEPSATGAVSAGAGLEVSPGHELLTVDALAAAELATVPSDQAPDAESTIAATPDLAAASHSVAALVQNPGATQLAAATALTPSRTTDSASSPRIVTAPAPATTGAAGTLSDAQPEAAVEVLAVSPAKPLPAAPGSTTVSNTSAAPHVGAAVSSPVSVTALTEVTADVTPEGVAAFAAGSPATQLAVSRMVTAPASAPVIATPAQVPQHVASLLPDGGSVTLALHPEDLGALVITVSRTGNSVSVTVTGSHAALASIAADAISDAIMVAGLSVARVELVPSANTTEGSRQAPSDSRSNDQQQGQGRQSGSERQGTQRDTMKDHDDQE